VSVQREESFEVILGRIGAACDEVEKGEGGGVLLLVDLQGSSPYQAAMAMLDGTRRAEVLCGVNLAMLMKLATLDRRELRPAELAELLREAGRRSIRLGSELTGRLPLGENSR
jgi:mannose/fructose-specific phosphotransferase system component IIA